MHVSQNGPPQQVALFLNLSLDSFPEMARVGHVGQPTHPYGCYHYRGGGDRYLTSTNTMEQNRLIYTLKWIYQCMLICNCRIARKKYIGCVGKLQNMYIYAFIPECLNSIPSSSSFRFVPNDPCWSYWIFLTRSAGSCHSLLAFSTQIRCMQINVLLHTFFYQWDISSCYVEDQAHLFQ